MTQLQDAPASAHVTPAPVEEGAPAPGRPFDDGRVLDAEVAAAQQEHPNARYGLGAVAVVVVAVVTELATAACTRRFGMTARAGFGLVAESLIGVAAVAAAWPLVRVVGSWREAVGLDRPRRKDMRRTAGWFGLQVATRMGVAYALIICIPPLRHQRVSNLTGIAHLTPVAVVLLLVGAVVVAPIVEEIMMRGIVLRASMRGGMGFWAAAVLNAVIFGGLHAYQGRTALAALVIAISTGAFGFVQCLLVRRRGRLTAAIFVHAATNLVAVGGALAAAAASH